MKISTTIFRQTTLVVFLFFAFSLSVFGAEETATLSFASTAQRTSYSTSKQVWQQNGITFTNNKASSSNAVADYANPVRLYANSAIIVEASGNIIKIVFDCNSSSYATALKNSIGNIATASSDKVTVTLDGTSTSFTVAKLTAQVRLDAITVTYSSGSEPEVPECTDPIISFASDSITKTNGDVNFTNTLNKGGSKGAVTYSSSSTAVATVNTTSGEVTIKGVGKTTITAIVAEDGTYCEGSAQYTLKVTGRTFDIIWMNGDKVHTTTTYTEGGTLVFPEDPKPSSGCQLEGWEFAGWSETQITENTTEVTLVSNPYIPTGNCTLYAVYSKDEEGVGEGAESWKLTDITNIKSTDEVVITMTNSNATYALTNGGGTSRAPVATKVDISNNVLINLPTENLIWNISSNSGVYNIYPNGVTNKWLYCTNANNGVRVGDNNNKTFKIKGNYLQHISTERYLGVYNNQDWRCYTSTGTNISGQTLGFYVKIIEFGTIITTIYNSNPDCADIEEHTVTFGDIAIETENGKIANIPELPDACNVEYSTKVGWSAMSTFGVATEEPELIDENTIFTEDTQLYPVYSKKIDGGETAWLLVTNVSSLAMDDEIIIVSIDAYYALSTNQKSDNREATYITKSGSKIIITNKVQILTLEEGTADGTFAFYTGSGYLYAASSSSNHLKTQTTNDANGSWKIEIADDGTATVEAQGTYSRNVMQYNPNNGSPLFACYSSTSQQPIVLYKKTAVTSTEYYICSDLIVESDTTFNVEDDLNINNLTIKSYLDQAGQLNTTNASITAGNVTIEKTIDASRYFFFSLPFDCNITNIEAFDVTAPTTPLEYYDDYTIFYYDQKKASDNKGAMGSKAWVEITDKNTQLKANQGYIIGYLVDEGIATIKFKSSYAQTISAPTATPLNIDSYTWYTDGGDSTANGWNLIGMPYYTKPANATLNCGDKYLYSTIPNQDGKTYSQVTFSEANISPFTSFFVQVANNEAPSFAIATQQSAAPMLRNKGAIRKAVVALSDANGGVDNTTIIDNPNTTADYEIGHDLVKWIGYAAIPQIYSIQGDDILAFNSRAIDNSTVIPLGVYAHADGEYTFSLDAKSAGDLQGWELYDNEEGKTIRLANETLTVYLEKGKHEGRFELRLQQRVATDCDTAMSNMQTWVENGKLNIDNMPVDARVYIYDAVGRMLYADNEVSASFSYDLPGRGVYSIVVSSAVETIAFKTIY